MGKRGVLSEYVSAALELTGVGLVNAGFWAIHSVAGLFATGISLVVIGLAVDPPKRRDSVGIPPAERYEGE